MEATERFAASAPTPVSDRPRRSPKCVVPGPPPTPLPAKVRRARSPTHPLGHRSTPTPGDHRPWPIREYPAGGPRPAFGYLRVHRPGARPPLFVLRDRKRPAWHRGRAGFMTRTPGPRPAWMLPNVPGSWSGWWSWLVGSCSCRGCWRLFRRRAGGRRAGGRWPRRSGPARRWRTSTRTRTLLRQSKAARPAACGRIRRSCLQ